MMTEKEFKELFHLNYNSLCNYATTIIKHDAAAEDIVQEIFIDFWKKHGNRTFEFKAENYIVRAVKFKCIDFLRKKNVHQNFIKDGAHKTENSLQPELDIDNSADLEVVVNMAIAQLPEKTKEVFVLSKIKKLSYKQIAQQLNISEKTIENQMSRAFKHLRIKLKDYRFYLFLFIFLKLSSGFLYQHDI